MTNKDFLSQFSGDNKKPDSFKEEERVKVTKEKKPVNVKLLVIILAVVLLIAGVILFFILRPTIEVKDFVGLNASEVKAWIKQNDIDSQGVIYREEYNFDYDEGYITYQSIESGKKVRKNVKIDFTVSLGADPEELVAVPDIESMYKDELQAWVKENKLAKTKVMTAYSDDVEEGAVISYEFKNGADADNFKRSSTLTITVSKGPQPAGTVTVSDFLKQDYSVVEVWGKKNNVEVIKVEKYDDEIPKDAVISQSIEANKTIKQGESITVVVSLGKGIVVPNFTAMSKSEIEKWTSENKEYCEVLWKHSSSNDYIIYQSISSGKYVGTDNKLELTLNIGNGFYLDELNSYIGEPYQRYRDYVENLDDMGIYVDAHGYDYVEDTRPIGTIIGIKQISSGSVRYSTAQKLPLEVDIRYEVSGGSLPLEVSDFRTVEDLEKYLQENGEYQIKYNDIEDKTKTISEIKVNDQTVTETNLIYEQEIIIVVSE